jgi:hypothetical protein
MNIVAVHFLTSEDQEMPETRIKQRAFRIGDKIGGLDCVFSACLGSVRGYDRWRTLRHPARPEGQAAADAIEAA